MTVSADKVAPRCEYCAKRLLVPFRATCKLCKVVVCRGDKGCQNMHALKHAEKAADEEALRMSKRGAVRQMLREKKR
jgi:hypothetical protein